MLDLSSNSQIVAFKEITVASFPNLEDVVKSRFTKILEKIQVYFITYLSNNEKIRGFLVLPKSFESKMPCIIFNRGGALNFQNLNPVFVISNLSFLALNGYAVIASQYAGNADSEGRDELGGEDLESVLNLKSVLEGFSFIDTTNIGMLGFSRGGMTTYQVLKQVDWVKSAVSVSSFSDLNSAFEQRPKLKEFYLQAFDVNNQVELTLRSAVCWPDQFCNSTPLLIIHGSSDDKVDLSQSTHLYNQLKQHHKPVKLEIFENGDHVIDNFKEQRNNLILDWFNLYLK